MRNFDQYLARICVANAVASHIAACVAFDASVWVCRDLVRVYVTYASRPRAPVGYAVVFAPHNVQSRFTRQRSVLGTAVQRAVSQVGHHFGANLDRGLTVHDRAAVALMPTRVEIESDPQLEAIVAGVPQPLRMFFPMAELCEANVLRRRGQTRTWSPKTAELLITATLQSGRAVRPAALDLVEQVIEHASSQESAGTLALLLERRRVALRGAQKRRVETV